MTRHLVTSALPYINGVKHLGNLVGSMLPADIYSRYLRQRGREVLFVCGTDEHGTPAEIAAQQAGQAVEDYAREQHEIQRAIYTRFELSFDVFGRSSSPQNHALTQHLADELERNGFIEERVTKQFYSIQDGRFLPDRYIVGTCPHCGSPARGDQCESCARVLDPTDLIDPRSAISGSRDLKLRETRHLYLLLSKLAPEVERWLAGHADWPLLVRSIAEKWLKEGLQDRAITRDLHWGVPVRRPGFEGKVFYVWFDAPIAYIGATRELADRKGDDDEWRRWWFDAEDVFYVQFMAKDNIPFHTVWWHAMLLGSREPWKLADYIKGFNWLNYYKGKFSTSAQRGVFMDAALELLPPDYWRYALMSNAPESDDVEFTWEAFGVSINKQLADNFGNFAQRVLSFAHKHFDGKVPSSGEWTPAEVALAEELSASVSDYTQALEAMEFRRAAKALEGIWALANRYWSSAEPWQAVRGDRAGAGRTVAIGLNLLRVLALLGAPWIPTATGALLRGLGVEANEWVDASDLRKELARLPAGTPLKPVPILFRKVTDEELEAWKARFAGSETQPVGATRASP